MHSPAAVASSVAVPSWAQEAIQLYESNAASQFIVYGNVYDEMLIPSGDAPRIGTLSEFLLNVLLPRFDVVLSYDIGNGIRVEKGGEIFSKWPQLQQDATLPKAPRPAIERLTHYFRYVRTWRGSTANIGRSPASSEALIYSHRLCKAASTTTSPP